MGTNYEHYDVLVAGGGTAGAVAAITVARHGLKVLVIEQMGYLGGTQTGALVTPMMELLIDGNPEISAVNYEIKERLEKQGDGRGNWFNPEGVKTVLEEMLLEAGGHLLYFTTVIDVQKDNNKLEGLVIHNKSGIRTITASVVIDCTGDADVARLAGVPFESGKKSTGVNQPMSVRFEMGNIDLAKFGSFLKELGQNETTNLQDFYGAHTLDVRWPLSPIFKKGLEEGIITKEDAKYFQFFAVPGKPGVLSFNCPEIFENVDGTNAQHLTEAMVKGRQAIKRLVAFMKSSFPGFEDAYLLMSAPMVGVRESRRILGEYYLTAQDVARYRKFEDGIVKCNYYMDIHDMSEEDKKRLQSFETQKIVAAEKYFEIPYRCCVPKGIENLLVAGRCISADFEAQSAMRIQQVCRALGEGCGHAAYTAIRKCQVPRAVDGKEVKKLMHGFGDRGTHGQK